MPPPDRGPAPARSVGEVVPGPRESPLLWLGLVTLLLLGWSLVRPHPYRELWLPMVADVLGRDAIPYGGETIAAEYGWTVRLLLVAVLVLFLLALRSLLVVSRFRGLRWASRLRVDAPFLLALMPFLALVPLWDALETAMLFRYPWAFLFVEPMAFPLMLVVFFASLALALWVEHGGAGRSLPRFGLVLLFFFALEVVWLRVLEATTVALPAWGYMLPPLVAYGTFFGVTLGHRLVSHRRVLFALGAHHVAFVGVFLLLWVLDGPWPAMEWSWRGIGTLRDVGPVRVWFGLLLVLVPIGITTGLFTLGSYLHRYIRLAAPWRDGVNVVLVFAQVLHAWVVTMASADPYGALGRHAAPGGLTGALLLTMGGWGYLAAKLAAALLVVHLLDRTFVGSRWLHGERRAVVKLLLIAVALLPGLSEAVRLGIGT